MGFGGGGGKQGIANAALAGGIGGPMGAGVSGLFPTGQGGGQGGNIPYGQMPPDYVLPPPGGYQPAPGMQPGPPPTGGGWGHDYGQDIRGWDRTLMPTGVNRVAPGVAEQAQQINEGFYRTPGTAERLQGQQEAYWNKPMTAQEAFVGASVPRVGQAGVGQEFIGQQLGQLGGMTGGANPTAQAYAQFQQNRPDIAQDPGLDPYYQNAQRRALEAINQNAATRGAYGSSAAMAQGQEAITDLAAEQANREAQYNLQRLGEQRAWEGLGGQLAGQQSQSQLGWAQGLGQLGLGAEGMGLQRQLGAANLAQQMQGMREGRMGQGFAQGAAAQQLGLGRMGQGFNEAMAAQGARENRLQNMINNQMAQQNALLPLILGAQEGLIGGDLALLNAQLGGPLAASQEAVNQQQRRREATTSGLGAAGSVMGGLGGLGWQPLA